MEENKNSSSVHNKAQSFNSFGARIIKDKEKYHRVDDHGSLYYFCTIITDDDEFVATVTWAYSEEVFDDGFYKPNWVFYNGRWVPVLEFKAIMDADKKHFTARDYRMYDKRFFFRQINPTEYQLVDSWDIKECPDVAVSRQNYEKLVEVLASLRGIIEIGKRDLTNPKYDGYFRSAKEVLDFFDQLDGVPAETNINNELRDQK